MLFKNALRTTVATAAFALLSAAAGASATSVIYGGGSTLAQPFYNAMFAVVNATSPAATFGTYDGIGSGAGRTQFETNTPNSAAGWPAGSTVHYGASDAFLANSEVANWSTTWVSGGVTIPNMQAADGNLIQLPMEGVPITIPYVETPNPNAKGVTAKMPALVLTDSDLCGLYSGKITDWSGVASVNAYIKAHPAAFGTPAFPNLTLTVRSDSSGTTFLFTQHLAKVCTSSNSNFNLTNFTGPVSLWTGSMFASGSIPTQIVPESGSGGVAGYLDGGNATTAGSGPSNVVGYLSPDYTSIAPKSANTTWLKVASLTNATGGGNWQPTVANTLTALSQTTSANATNATPPSTEATAVVPQNWVPTMPTPASGYPIVGYTQWIVTQCYQDKNVSTTLIATLKNQVNKKYASELAVSGFTAIPAAYGTAILDTFLSNKYAYKPSLAIEAAAVCKAAGSTGKIVGR